VNQVLSQSEVDALLAAVSDGDVQSSDSQKGDGGGGGGGGGGVKAVDDRKIVAYDLTSHNASLTWRQP